MVRLLTLLAESDLEWILALWTACMWVCWDEEVGIWEKEGEMQHCSYAELTATTCRTEPMHWITEHTMIFLISCHLEGAWNTAYKNQWEKSRYASPPLSIDCRDTVPSTAETAGELTSSCLSLSVLLLLVRASIGKWVEVVGGAEIELSHAISRPLSKDVVLFSCCLFSSSCNFSSFFLIRCLALLEGLCFLAAATSCVFVVDGAWLFNASLFDGTLRFASRSNEWSLALDVNFVLCGNGKNLLYPYNEYNMIRMNTEFYME